MQIHTDKEDDDDDDDEDDWTYQQTNVKLHLKCIYLMMGVGIARSV
jgi:hypothetical protein